MVSCSQLCQSACTIFFLLELISKCENVIYMGAFGVLVMWRYANVKPPQKFGGRELSKKET